MNVWFGVIKKKCISIINVNRLYALSEETSKWKKCFRPGMIAPIHVAH
jgi:hypothetical protein